MKKLFLALVICALPTLILSALSWAQCPEEPEDRGECDTLNVICLDCDVDTAVGGPYTLTFPLLVTHDQTQWDDSIAGFAVPLGYTHTNPSAYCSLGTYWNNTLMLWAAPGFEHSIFRHIMEGADTLYRNRMAQLEGDFSNRGWDYVFLDLDGTSHFWLTLVPTGSQNQRWWESDRVLLATMTMRAQDTMHVCIDSVFWPPSTPLSFSRSDGELYTPRDNLPRCFWAGAPRMQVISPNGGETWGAGTSQTITWLSENFGKAKANVKIEYSTNSGGSWTPVQHAVPDTGSYLWIVPDTPSENCLVRISDAADGDPYDVSDANFAIGYPDFSIQAEPDTLEIQAGDADSLNVILTSRFGHATPCTLTLSGLPADAGGSFDPNPATPTDTSLLFVTTARTTPPGTYPVTVTAIELFKGQIQHSTQVILIITPPPDFSIQASPDTLQIPQDAEGDYQITLTSLHGFDSPCTLTVGGLPPEVTGIFNPPTLVPTGLSNLNISVPDTADTGFYDLIITATEMAGSKQVEHSVQVVLRITPPPDFTVEVTPDTLQIPQGEEDSYEVVLISLWGFDSTCTLTVSGLPPEVTGTFDPPTIVPTGMSDLSISVPDTADTGFYDLTITATEITGSKQVQHAVQVVLRITPPRDFTIEVTPDTQVVQASFSVDYDVILTSLWGFASPCTLTVSGLPLGASADFDPNPSTPTDVSVMSIGTDRATPPGTYNLTITATELTKGQLQHSTQVVLIVTPPPDFTIEVQPDSQEVQATYSVDFEVILTSLYGFASPCTLTATGLPLGTTAIFDPNPATPTDTSVMSIYTTRTTTPGTYSITVTATELGKAQVHHSTQLKLTITPPPDFTIEAEPDTQEVQATFSVDFDVILTSLYGFASPCTLTTAGLPNNASVDFDPNPVIPSDSSLMSVYTTRETPPGTYQVTVTATELTGDQVQHSTQVVLIVTPPPDFTVDVEPDSQEVQAGNSVDFDVTLTSLYGFTSTCTLTVSDLPANASGSFDPDLVTPTGTSNLQIGTTVSTPPGVYTVTVTGSELNKGLIRTDQLVLNVTPPPDFTIEAQPETLQVLSGEMDSYQVTLTSLYGFDSPCTLSVAGIPQGVSAGFDPPTLIPTGSSDLSIAVNDSAPTGYHPLIITATEMETGKQLQHSIEVFLITGCIVIRVDQDYPTIQEAVEAAHDCDTVLVAPGYYLDAGNRNVDFGGKEIVVKSQAGPESTIIHCVDDGRGFYFHNSEGPDSKLEGFTITKGLVGDFGGGILCIDSDPTIFDCRIEDNSALHSGGGICLQGSSPNIISCSISDNSATSESSEGGGIACDLSSFPTITNCTIVRNGAATGGGVRCGTNSSPTITNSIIAFNISEGIYGWPTSSCSVSCCDVYGNPDGNYAGILADLTGINGNISECPLFCDLSDNQFYISETSPCASDNNECEVLMGAWDTGCNYLCGDATADWQINVADVVYLLNYLYRGGAPPQPLQAGDVNCDGTIDVSDVVYLLNYLYKGGPQPCD